MIRINIKRFSLVSLAASLGCGAQAPTQIPADAQRVAFEQMEALHTPISGFADPVRLVVTDREAWEQAWSEFHASVDPVPAAPEIDFSERMVLVAAMGRRSSGGFGISIEGVFNHDARLLVQVLEVSAGPMCVTTSVITHPATAVVTDRQEAPVEWVETTRQNDC